MTPRVRDRERHREVGHRQSRFFGQWELGTTLSPWDALMGWIERFTEFVGTKRGLASALHSGDPAYDDLPQHLMDRLEPALHTLLARAVVRRGGG